MDPLSIATGVIAIANLAAFTCSAISDLRSLCKGLPGRLHAISNEVADLELVLTEVSMLLRERNGRLGSQQSVEAIPHLLAQAKSKLLQLDAIVKRLAAASAGSKLPLLGASAWRKEQGNLQALQEDIRTIKSSLNILLGASNSYGSVLFFRYWKHHYSPYCRQDMMRIRLDVQEISAITVKSSEQSQASMAGIEERVARVEELIRAQSEQLQARQYTQIGSSYTAPDRRSDRMSDRMSLPASPQPQDGISVRVRPRIATCRLGCSCSCHKEQSSTTPAFLNGILGRLFVGYSGLPILSPNCDSKGCWKSQTKQVSVEYWFPTNIWSTIVRVQMGSGFIGGPSLQLDTLRRIPDASQCVDFAQNGNIRGLQHLFKHGLASPRDVSSSRGYTLLRWALYSKQYETVVFLVHAGADPDYRPIASSDNSPRVKACHFLLEGGLSETASNAMRTITSGSHHLDEFIDSSNFTQTHKIVLGLSMRNLEEELMLSPSDIDSQDAMGRTPLAWAAARGDAQMVATLLSYDADPNITDVQISGPLSNAAAQGHTACVELLLEAGADPDPLLPKGVKKGTPLSVAARNSNDAMLLKRLLDFGANVDTLTVEDKTPLFHVARNDNASFAMLLLEYGADINATATTGETPLTTAITYNSHNVLRLFLDRWSEYTACPRLKGPNLVQIAALYADCETLSILASADHFRSMHDQQYALGNFETLLSQRADATDKLTLAFDELLAVINMAPNRLMGKEGLAESGLSTNHLRLCPERHKARCLRGDGESDEESDDSFQDAMEKLEIIT